MFSLSFDSSHRVLLAQFAGVLSSQDIEGLHNALVAFVAHHGFARGILDFSSVQANALPHSFLMRRARLPQILLRQERIIVAPQQELHELARAYVAQQRDFGNLEGQIVRTLDDAYLALDLKQPDFRPLLTATDYLSQLSSPPCGGLTPDLLRRQLVRSRLSRLCLFGEGPPKAC
jgi:hypothetical protein